MLLFRNRNIKNSYLILGFIISILIIITGAILKINKIESGNVVLVFGFIVKVQVILMTIYKYGYLIRRNLTK
jgi:hypothetical protein